MKKVLAITVAAAIVAMAGAAFASGTATVTVNATVVGTCQVNSAPTLTLTLDPTSALDASASGNISLWCTKNTAFTVQDPNGTSTGTYNTSLAGNDVNTTGKSIPMAIIYNTGGTGAGKGTAINSSVTASVLNTDFVNATAGSYTKQVVMTINP